MNIDTWEDILGYTMDELDGFNGKGIQFTFSAGISDCTEIIEDELINIADQRTYHAKNTGKNKVILKV